MAKKINMKPFDKFTNLYEFSKTLQFSLIPLKWDKNNQKIIEDYELSILKKGGVIDKDKQIAENVKAAKFYLDILHRELISNALGNLEFGKENLESIYSLTKKIERNKKDKQTSKEEKKKTNTELNKQLAIKKDAFLMEIGDAFVKGSKELITDYSINDEIEDGKNILLSKYALKVLKKRFTKEEVERLKRENGNSEAEYINVTYLDREGNEKSVFEMKAGYLDDFHKNRELLYSVKGKKGSLGRRVFDNFVLFCKNKRIFEEKYKSSDVDFSGVEKQFEVKMKDFFGFEYYNRYVSQAGIDEYNKILGGESRKQERKANVEGLNQIINFYIQQKEREHKERQKEKQGKKVKFNNKNYPFFAPLQRQILSEVFKKEILIETDRDLIQELKVFLKDSRRKVAKAQEIVELFLGYKRNGLDLAKIYLPKSKINSFTYKVFKEPQDFLAVFRDGRSNLDIIDFGEIKNYLENNELEYKEFFKALAQERKSFDAFLSVWKYEFYILINGGETIVKGSQREKLESLETKRKALDEKLRWFADKVKKNEKMSDEDEGQWCSAVLAYSQTILDITKRSEMFWLNEKQAAKISEDDKDKIFYPQFNKFADDDFIPFFYFDKFRNYLNKRSRNTIKDIKFYFDNEHLLDGWDINKEYNFWGFLLRKNNDYFLGIGNKKGEIFHDAKGREIKNAYEAGEGDGFYEKIEYKQLDIGKFEGIAFPKKTNSEQNLQAAIKKRSGEFLKGDVQELKRLLTIKKDYDDFKEQRQKDKAWDREFPKEKMRELIKYYITCLGERKDDWSRFNLQFKKPEEYRDRDDFVAHIQRQAYWIEPKKVSKKYIDEKVADGEMFLFKIHSKDFYDFEKKLSNNNPYKSDHKPSKINLFTQYFLELFSDKNIQNIKNKDLNKSIFELDGKAEIRFRPKTDEVKLKAYKKNGKELKYIDKRDGNKTKEVIQHRRFAKDALTLHLKMRLNFGKSIDFREFNKLINTKILAQVPVKILGIDRGENNLLYYCVLKENGEIEKCGSLNKIGERIRKLDDGTKIKEPIDYHQKLVEREEQRDWEQQNWQKITPIKDLKSGYLGYVKNWVTKTTSAYLGEGVATLNVLEDLSGNFKRTRFFRERQIYQNFEKELIDKLNYLVDKDQRNYRHAYQLTPLISSVEEMENNRQLGTVVYVPAGFTSKICPKSKCGWRKKMNIKNSETKEKIVNLLKSGLELRKKDNSKVQPGAIKISYKKEEDRFCFEYKWEQEYNNDGKKEKYSDVDKVFSNVSRLRWNNSQRKSVEFKDKTDNSITSNLKSLLAENGITLSGNINDPLIKRQKELDIEFFRSIIFYFNLIMQIRNYGKKKEEEEGDYIQCPACLFDSRSSVTNGKLKAIKDGDANGAYNVARKGLMLLYRIKESPYSLNLFINNKDYDEAVSDWDKHISQNSPR